MGLERTVYIGAAIKIPIQYRISVEGKHKIWVDDLVESEEFFECFLDTHMYIFSNMGVGLKESTPISLTQIDQLLIERSIEDFKSKHKKGIEILRQKIEEDINVGFYVFDKLY